MRKRTWILGFTACCIISTLAFLFAGGLATHYELIIYDSMNFDSGNLPPNVSLYKNGVLVEEAHNAMTDVGCKLMIFQVFNSSYTKLTWNVLEIGTGTQTVSSATKLNAYAANSGALAPGTSGNCQWWKTTNTWGLNYTFTGLTATITEAGIFNSTAGSDTSTKPNSAWYVTFTGIALSSTDTLLTCWKGTDSGS